MEEPTPLTISHAATFRFVGANKAPQLQIVTHAISKDAAKVSSVFGDVYSGSWAFFAPPSNPSVDATGNVSGACNTVVAGGLGDQQVILGQRDVRWSKYFQDLAAGESAHINAFGSRLALKEASVSLNAGGGFLTFDITGKKVGLAGIPASAGAAAPYLSIDTASIGLVSASGAGSVTVSDAQVTLSGSSVSLDAGTIHIGKGATDPVVTHSQLLSLIGQLVAQVSAHMLNPAAHTTATVPLVLIVQPGTRVFAPPL